MWKGCGAVVYSIQVATASVRSYSDSIPDDRVQGDKSNLQSDKSCACSFYTLNLQVHEIVVN